MVVDAGIFISGEVFAIVVAAQNDVLGESDFNCGSAHILIVHCRRSFSVLLYMSTKSFSGAAPVCPWFSAFHFSSNGNRHRSEGFGLDGFSMFTVTDEIAYCGAR